MMIAHVVELVTSSEQLAVIKHIPRLNISKRSGILTEIPIILLFSEELQACDDLMQ